jgi:hypothetical protein
MAVSILDSSTKISSKGEEKWFGIQINIMMDNFTKTKGQVLESW